MKYIAIIFVLTAFVSETIAQEVKVAGTLRDIMMGANTKSSIQLSDLSKFQHLYAVGAFENLNGEILIWDSKPTITKIVNDSITLQSTFNGGAALLVYSQVNDWTEFVFDEDVNLTGLEAKLQKIAEENNITQPFTFLIHADVSNLNGHIIRENNSDNKHDQGFKVSVQDKPINILGFYSEHHQGVFTHHGSTVHMHFINDQSTISGHVDDVVIKSKSVILLPKKP